ncbi:MAG: 2OG-Fe(II) oxygenase family protein [Nanoarchaeota archaeon]
MELKEWIKVAWLEEKTIEDMNEEFNQNRPFKHVFITEFLKKEKAEELEKALKGEIFERKESDLFRFNQTYDLQDSDNAVILEFSEMLESKEFADFIGKIVGIDLGAGALDLFGSLYENTDYLLCHDDLLEDRKIAYLLYLSDLEEKDGGALTFLSDKNGEPGEVIKRYFPRFNGFMFFAVTSKSWHEVEEVIGNKKRYAIGGWLH